MIFVSLWSAFAISLYLLNTEKKRVTVSKILNFSPWKAAILIFSGFLGGLFTALTGSGVDICTFAVLTFVFRLSENFAAPSGIAMMAFVSQFCVFWRAAILQEFDSLALDYVKVCVPSVSLFVPLGSFLGSHFHRITIAFLVSVLEILAMAGFLATMPSLPLLLCSATVIVAGFLLFTALGKIGTKLLHQDSENIKEQKIPF
uniref:Membrane transporter protein n=1 Tax=Panagrolaimus superbus TaxID=310955 RepID=A0A914Y4W8_9BILA